MGEVVGLDESGAKLGEPVGGAVSGDLVGEVVGETLGALLSINWRVATLDLLMIEHKDEPTAVRSRAPWSWERENVAGSAPMLCSES